MRKYISGYMMTKRLKSTVSKSDPLAFRSGVTNLFAIAGHFVSYC